MFYAILAYTRRKATTAADVQFHLLFSRHLLFLWLLGNFIVGFRLILPLPLKQPSSGILRVSKQKTMSCTKARLDIATGLNKESWPPPIDELLRDKWEFRLGISKCKSGPVPSGNGYHK